MADSEKGDSSTGKAKGKTSMLDDDISKDFLGSWKSMSMAGGDDMDFNFEPVTKGNKKPFDFGKLDMDFSLDGEFEKMSSFKIDMPDLDFSNSPKKSTKSKKTSEVESGKGRNCSKNNDFTFSFDFNGMDDFSLDTPSTKGGKSPSREKSSKEVGFSKEIECEDLPKQVDDDDGKAAEDTTGKTPPISEIASNLISENLMDSKRNFDASFANCSSKSAIEVDMLKPEGIISSSEKNLTGEVQETDQHHHLADRTAFDDSGVLGAEKDVHPIPESRPSKSTSLKAAVELVDTKKSSDTEKMLTVEGTDEEEQIEKGISKQSYTEQKVKDLSANSLLGKMPRQSPISEEMEVSSLHEKQNDRSELSTLNGQLSAVTGEKLKPDKSSSECLTDKMNVGYGETKTPVVGSISTSKLTCHSMDPSATNASEALPCETRSKAETQRLALKVFSSPFGSGSTLAKPTVMAFKVPGSYNSKFPRVDNTKQGVRANLSIMERKNKCSTHSSAAGDRNESHVASSKDNGKKIDSNPNSCTKEVVKQDSVAKITEKNAYVDTLSSRDSDNNMKQKTQSEMGIDTVLHGHNRQAKDEHFVLGSEKKIEDVKSFSFDAPLCAPSQQESKFSKQMSSKFEDKIPSIVPIQKSNVSQMNKLPSLTVGKKLSGFPISRSSMNAAINKHSASPAVGEDAKSTGTFENKLLAKSKTGPPVGSEKQRPSPSLKRKPSEAADEGPKNPHPLKRLSPSESRMSKGMSPGKAMEEVYTKGSLSEGKAKNVAVDHPTSKFDFYPETSMEDLGFTVVLESDANVEKAEACAKELEDICNMLKKKHEEAKELLVRALVNNNNLLMLNHPIYEEKIHAVQRFADRLMSKELKAGV